MNKYQPLCSLILMLAFCNPLYPQISHVQTKTADSLNTPLDVTLKWLKNELSKYGTTSRSSHAVQLKPMNFSGCQISFRYTPVIPPGFELGPNSWRLPPEEEYSLNLADLNPGSLSVNSSKSGTRILVGTWNLEPKIRIVTKNAVTGERDPSYLDQQNATMILDLAKTKSAPQIRDAFVHAITLCQSRP